MFSVVSPAVEAHHQADHFQFLLPLPFSGLCPGCEALYGYAAGRIARCPHMETKTFCSACKTHCYRPEMREQIRAVMRYAGPRMLFHHPVAAVKHLLVGRAAKSKKEGGRLV